MLDVYRREIAALLDCGYALPEVEAEVIESAAGLSDDERAALWLYAWSYRDSYARAVSEYGHATIG